VTLARAFEDGPALVPYVVAGDPSVAATREYVEALVEGGADLVELGLPFSEPIADGPTIQEGIVRALEGGMTPARYLDLVAGLDVEVPVACMTYYNVIFRYGDGDVDPFVADAAAAGVEGLIVPDLPVEEADPLRAACDRHGLDLVFIVAPTTDADRVDRMLAVGSGFLYVQARLGTTGAREDVDRATHESLRRVRERGTELPLAVGFGVSERAHAAEIASAGADGVVAGSVFVDRIARGVEADQDHGAVADALRERAAELARGVETGEVETETEAT
jgi:tryptophan synthase alpha chain